MRTLPSALRPSRRPRLFIAAWLATAGLLGLVAACEPDVPDFPRGDPSQVVLRLTESHPGWTLPDCSVCHGGAHNGDFTLNQCSICHGANGAPRLGGSHPGWGLSGCASCHAAPTGHATGLADEGCAGCHGDNGGAVSLPTYEAPEVDETHTGWLRADCGACHSESGSHGGIYEITACGACHGTNGGPTRPANHWLTDCNECHADGAYPWNACSHAGFEPLAPRACIFCHK